MGILKMKILSIYYQISILLDKNPINSSRKKKLIISSRKISTNKDIMNKESHK